MRSLLKAMCVTGALALLCGAALAQEEMPVVVDQPLTQADLEELEARKQEQLVSAQQLLADLGYLNGAADGIIGPRTTAAVKAFQAEQGLPQSGELDRGTLQALEDMAGTVDEAKRIQQRLIDLGFLRGTADGIFGERSRKALALFQTLHGLERTGKLDDATREKLFSDKVTTLPARLAVGDRGDEVAALQEKLIQYGFLFDDADGSYGRLTVAAVKRFQKHLQAQGIDESLGVEATGEATPVTRMLLLDPDYSSYLSDLTPGGEGDEVARVERRLAQLGYMDAQPDEAFDDYAVSAAQAFCGEAGLPGDTFDRAFIDALFAADAPAAEHFVLHDIAYGDRGIAVREVQEALVLSGMTVIMPGGAYNDNMMQALERVHDYLLSGGSDSAALFEDTGHLSVEAQRVLTGGGLEYRTGSADSMDEEMTLRVQRRLHTLFFMSKYGIDGLWGESTTDALSAFQETNGLPVTGDADEDTLSLLFSTDAVCKQYPYRVEVDISSQRVYVFQLNDLGEYEKIKTFVCSTGLGDSTPRGIYLDGFPANAWHHFTKFDCWARYSFEIEGDIMFHSVLFSAKDTDTLREGSLYALGSKASHGCVRLAVRDAEWLFVNCKRGSLVIVIY